MPATPCGRTRDLTARQEAKLASIAQTNKALYRAYVLKEQLRQVCALKGPEGIALLDAWLKWARRCRIPSFVKLAKAITGHRTGVEAALTHGLSNARVESVNTKLRLLTRIASGSACPKPRGPGHARPRRPVPALPGRG